MGFFLVHRYHLELNKLGFERITDLCQLSYDIQIHLCFQITMRETEAKTMEKEK